MDSLFPNNLPHKPYSIEETGLTILFLKNLALKTLYVYNSLLGREVAGVLKLPYLNVVAKILGELRREYRIEIGGSAGSGEAYYRYVITDSGRRHARELMEDCQYVGAAPVTLEAYTEVAKVQSLVGQTVGAQQLREALSHLVLSDAFLDGLGPALNSGGSLFLYGKVGNGKTSIGLAIPQALCGAVGIPYAISVGDQIIRVFDEVQHHRITGENGERGMQDSDDTLQYDRRWAVCQRTLIVGGGEMTLKDLDLFFDPTMKYYQAPHQMKANGGVFLIDDFGRQMPDRFGIQPLNDFERQPRDGYERQLLDDLQSANPDEAGRESFVPWYGALNRWIVPLAQRKDSLTLKSGQKISVPFEVLVVFATNLDPLELMDEAYWRRMRNKIHVPNPTWDQFREIFTREADRRKIPYSEEAFQYFITEYYLKPKRQPRGVHPRDVLDTLEDIARFRGIPPSFSKENVDHACQVYFVVKAPDVSSD